MIKSFRGEFARTILRDRKLPKGFTEQIAQVARRKLVQFDNAIALSDLAAPPGNRLEMLKGKLSGRHSMRINDQWRIVFGWTRKGPEEVEIVDYH